MANFDMINVSQKRRLKKLVRFTIWYIIPSIILSVLIIPPLFSDVSEVPTQFEPSLYENLEFSSLNSTYPDLSPISFGGNENISAHAQGGDGQSWGSAYFFENFSVNGTNSSCISLWNTTDFIVFRNIQLQCNFSENSLAGIKFVNCNNIRLQNISINSASGSIGSGRTGIFLTNCTSISTVDKVIVSNFYNGIYANQIKSCSFQKIVAIKNHISFLSQLESRDIVFNQCYFEGYPSRSFYETAIQFSGFSNYSNISILSSMFNMTNICVWLVNSIDCLITDNLFVGTTYSVYISNVSHFNIWSNFFLDSQYSISMVKGFDINIWSNYFNQAGVMRISTSGDLNISKNLFIEDKNYLIEFYDTSDYKTIKFNQNILRGGTKKWMNQNIRELNYQLFMSNRVINSLIWWIYTVGFGISLAILLIQLTKYFPEAISKLKFSSLLYIKKPKKELNEFLKEDYNNLASFMPYFLRTILIWAFLLPITRYLEFFQEIMYGRSRFDDDIIRFINGIPYFPEIMVGLLWIGGFSLIYIPLIFKKNKFQFTIRSLFSQIKSGRGLWIRFLLYSSCLWLTFTRLAYIQSLIWYGVYPLLALKILSSFWEYWQPNELVWRLKTSTRKKIINRMKDITILLFVIFLASLVPPSAFPNDFLHTIRQCIISVFEISFICLFVITWGISEPK